MAAFAAKTRNVSPHHVRQAAADARYSLPPGKSIVAPLLMGIGITCTIVGIGMIALHLLRPASPLTPKSAAAAPAPAVASMPVSSTASSPAGMAASPGLTAPTAPPTQHAAAPGLSATAAALLEESRTHIEQSPSSSYFVQLQRVSASDAASLDAFLQRARASLDPAQLRLYQATIDGRVRYGVIFGDYGSAKEAAIAIAKMPDWIRALGVYPRQYSALH
jgi:septal ring-binding cell division protein DamX